jgi:hypothetical protein
MEDHVKQAAVWAGVGAALGVGVALGLGLRFLAVGALAGLGAGAAIGVATGLKVRGGDNPIPAYEAPALH